jgi:hypothetical protein
MADTVYGRGARGVFLPLGKKNFPLPYQFNRKGVRGMVTLLKRGGWGKKEASSLMEIKEWWGGKYKTRNLFRNEG